MFDICLVVMQKGGSKCFGPGKHCGAYKLVA